MGIKRAIAACVLGLLTAAVAPLRAEDNPDEVATQRDPEDRADAKHAADPSEMDRSLVDRDYVREPTDDDDQIHDSEHVVRNPTLKKPRLGAGAVKNDSEDMVDDAENDPRDHSRTPDRRAKKDPPKDAKKVAPKDAPKSEVDKKTGPAKDNKKRPAGCVDVSGEARFASIGYDHIVTLKSDCKKAVKCQVRTNVTSEPVGVDLAPAAEETVVTWRGSPAREFTPDVTCK
jgi:hypothetical protein